MAKEKFAYESGKVSISFPIDAGLGDCLIARKVFDALVELVPDCLIDVFYFGEHRKAFAKSFYGDSKNLNIIVKADEVYQKHARNYDLSMGYSCFGFINLFHANVQRLTSAAPKLLEAVSKIDEYNKRFVYRSAQDVMSIMLRQMTSARILGKNIFYFMSCGGALPIYDDRVNIKLFPEYRRQFDKLKLKNYITIYSNISEKDRDRPKVKTWPVRHLYEYVARMKKQMPQINIVQCGGGGELSIENADRHFLGSDLELTKYILANSLLHVGCEGGLVHLATALGTKCLVLFGPSGADYVGYDRNINLVNDICVPCMYINDNGDLNVCMRGNKEPPCMLSHTPQTVCEITCNYLKNKA